MKTAPVRRPRPAVVAGPVCRACGVAVSVSGDDTARPAGLCVFERRDATGVLRRDIYCPACLHCPVCERPLIADYHAETAGFGLSLDGTFHARSFAHDACRRTGSLSADTRHDDRRP